MTTTSRTRRNWTVLAVQVALGLLGFLWVVGGTVAGLNGVAVVGALLLVLAFVLAPLLGFEVVRSRRYVAADGATVIVTRRFRPFNRSRRTRRLFR